MTRRGQRGVVLLTALMIAVLMVSICGFLFRMRYHEFANRKLEADIVVSTFLAEAGIADARIKLSKDPIFPPFVLGQTVYNYNGEVKTDDGSTLGWFTVSIRRDEPNEKLLLSSRGTLGTFDLPAAEHQISVEISTTNHKIVHWQDDGAL